MAQHNPEVRALRRRLREQRLALDAASRWHAERAICAALLRLPLLRGGARVAFYLAMPGEVDLSGCLGPARRRGLVIHVPRITSLRRREMRFVPLPEGAARRRNAFGIEEPLHRRPAAQAAAFDVVILPLLGFDRRGNRLGMGAGFYDRALRCRRDGRRLWRRPRLVGVGFSMQEVPAIPAAPWDVPLDLVVTEREVIVPGRDCPSRSIR